MKRLVFLSFIVLVIFAFAAMSYAQEQKPDSAKNPVKKAHKEAVTEKGKSEKVHMKLNEKQITEVQNALISAGYLKEKATGKLDDNTKKALEEYQKANNLKVTGTPDKETRVKLGIKPSPPAIMKKEGVKKPESEPAKKDK